MPAALPNYITHEITTCTQRWWSYLLAMLKRVSTHLKVVPFPFSWRPIWSVSISYFPAIGLPSFGGASTVDTTSSRLFGCTSPSCTCGSRFGWRLAFSRTWQFAPEGTFQFGDNLWIRNGFSRFILGHNLLLLINGSCQLLLVHFLGRSCLHNGSGKGSIDTSNFTNIVGFLQFLGTQNSASVSRFVSTSAKSIVSCHVCLLNVVALWRRVMKQTRRRKKTSKNVSHECKVESNESLKDHSQNSP
jgi:hypothetical protein